MIGGIGSVVLFGSMASCFAGLLLFAYIRASLRVPLSPEVRLVPKSRTFTGIADPATGEVMQIACEEAVRLAGT